MILFPYVGSLIATRDGIFKLSIEGAAMNNESVVSIGSGNHFAYGAVSAIDSFSKVLSRLR